MIIWCRNKEKNLFWKLHVMSRWAARHDNGALVSCGLTVGQDVSQRSIDTLVKQGRATPVTEEQWKHSGCQSRCVLRGDDKCQW